MSHSFADRVLGLEERGPLPYWTPTPRSPAVIGRVVEYQAVDTEYGKMHGAVVELIQPAPVMEKGADRPRLAEPGEEISIWFKHTVLRNAWYEPKPGGGPPRIGEVVGVKRIGERTKPNGQTYPTFGVLVDGREGVAPPVPSDVAGTPMTQAQALDPSLGDPGFPAEPEEDFRQGPQHEEPFGSEDDLPF